MYVCVCVCVCAQVDQVRDIFDVHTTPDMRPEQSLEELEEITRRFRENALHPGRAYTDTQCHVDKVIMHYAWAGTRHSHAEDLLVALHDLQPGMGALFVADRWSTQAGRHENVCVCVCYVQMSPASPLSHSTISTVAQC